MGVYSSMNEKNADKNNEENAFLAITTVKF